MQHQIPSPNIKHLLTPLLCALPAAAVSPIPPESLLPFLSPILRQRVQILSATSPSTEAWLPLLCYDTSPTILKKLVEIAQSHEGLEAHPVSGEVELDWDEDVDVLFRRADEETLHARVVFKDVGLWARLVWCSGDAQGEGGPDGWRIGEVGVVPDDDDDDDDDDTETLAESGGWRTVGEAEGEFRGDAVREAVSKSSDVINGTTAVTSGSGSKPDHQEEEECEDDDDDEYWAQYDDASSTPAAKRSPAPRSMTSYTNGGHNNNGIGGDGNANATDEDAYYAQYESVQPAMDNHDPDEAVGINGIESTLNGTSTTILHVAHVHPEFLQHPRPSLSRGSNNGDDNGALASVTVQELERKADVGQGGGGCDEAEAVVRQHISGVMKSLWRLSRGVGMEVRVLGMLEEQEEG